MKTWLILGNFISFWMKLLMLYTPNCTRTGIVPFDVKETSTISALAPKEVPL